MGRDRPDRQTISFFAVAAMSLPYQDTDCGNAEGDTG